MPNEKLTAIDEATNTPLDTALSPALHSSTLAPHGESLIGSPTGESIYRSGRTALRAVHTLLSDGERALSETRRAVAATMPPQQRGSVPQIPAAQANELHSALMTRFASSFRTFQGGVAAVEDGIAKLNADIDRAVADPHAHKPSSAAAASDVRSVLRGMPAAERFAAVTNAIAEQDVEMVRAVVFASPFASGFSRQQHAQIRDLFERAVAPDAYSQRAAGHQVLAKLTAAQELAVKHFDKLLPKRADESPLAKSLTTLRQGAA